MKFSVIVPIYKAENYLDKAINSVLTQNNGNFELILIDDGSPDNCPQICDEYAKKDDRIKVFHKQNGGVSSARNVGVKNATGEYILFLDADDWLLPGVLNHCEEVINSLGKVDYFSYSTKITSFDGCIYPLVFANQDKTFATEKEKYLFLKYVLENDKFNTVCWRSCFNLAFLKQNNLYFNENLNIAEDIAFNLFVFFASDRYIQTEFLGINHLEIDNSLSIGHKGHAIINKMIDVAFTVLEDIRKRNLSIFDKNYNFIFYYLICIGQALIDVTTDENALKLLQEHYVNNKKDFYVFHMKKALRKAPKIVFNEMKPENYFIENRKRALLYYSINHNEKALQKRLNKTKKRFPLIKFATRAKRRIKGWFKK